MENLKGKEIKELSGNSPFMGRATDIERRETDDIFHK